MDVHTGNLLKKINTIKENIYTGVSPIDKIRFKEGELKGAEAVSYNDSDWDTFSVGHFWGGRDLTCWFRIPIEIPKENTGNRYAVIIQPGKRYFFDASQGGDYREYELLVYLDGTPLQSVQRGHNCEPCFFRRSGLPRLSPRVRSGAAEGKMRAARLCPDD